MQPLAVSVSARWRIASATPHRIFFLSGAVQLVAVMLYWLATLVGWYTAAWAPPPLRLDPVAAHAFLMIYGLFPFFIFGFLDTTFPHWLNRPPLGRHRYLPSWALMTLGMALFYAGLFADWALATAGAALYATGALINIAPLIGDLWRSRSPRRSEVVPVAAALAGAAAGGACFGMWLAIGAGAWLQASINAGLWLFLLPLVVTVSYRLIPFFSSRRLAGYTPVKPRHAVPVIWALLALRFALVTAGLDHWLLVCDLPLALMGAWLSLRWRFWRTLRVPLLAMLHVSFAWFAIGMGLYAFNDVLVLRNIPGLGMGPLHAIGIGLLGGILIAMASRVSLGHSGRPLVADGVTRWAFAAIQVAALSRILSAAPCIGSQYATWVLVAGAAWLLAVVPWSARFAAIYLRPRADEHVG